CRAAPCLLWAGGCLSLSPHTFDGALVPSCPFPELSPVPFPPSLYLPWLCALPVEQQEPCQRAFVLALSRSLRVSLSSCLLRIPSPAYQLVPELSLGQPFARSYLHPSWARVLAERRPQACHQAPARSARLCLPALPLHLARFGLLVGPLSVQPGQPHRQTFA